MMMILRIFAGHIGRTSEVICVLSVFVGITYGNISILTCMCYLKNSFCKVTVMK